jgi:hypothetical protein
MIKNGYETEAISKLGFSVEIKTRPRINPQAYFQYVEDLIRGLNAETCPPLAGRAKGLF